MSTSFTQVFGGTTIYPSDVSYLPLALDADISLEWPLEATTGNNVVARIIDVTPTGPYIITLPDAMSVGVGQTILFNNLGPDTITVDSADGNAILSIGAGEQWQCYLIDNTTAAGTWRTFRYGAAVAQAQAAALAGAGLFADGSTLAQEYEVIDFSITPYSLTGPDRAKVFVWGGGLGTLNLPTAAAVGDGWFVQVRNGGQGDLTIDPSGTELINAGSTLRLQPGDSAVIVSDGVQWYTIGLGQQAVFAFDYTAIDVSPGGTYTLAGSELNRIAYKFTSTGPLTSNVNVVVPSTVQQYWVNNDTDGPFTLGVKTASGTATLVTQGATAILYCDGTDIISATTSAAFVGTVPVTQGGTSAVTADGALTNLGGTGIGTSVFKAATTAAARSAIAAAASGANSDITSITGLTTALTVAQGGTGANNDTTARANLNAAKSGSNADITALTNAAGIQIGAPTAGAQGAGTINATGLFINGVGVGTGSGSVTSVAATVPSFLSISGSPITTSGTLAISLSGTALPVANGGTGQTTYTDGQLLIGNTTGNTLTKATLTAGSGISITNGSGSVTIASTAGGGTVTSVDASGGTTGLTFTGGPVTTTGTLTVGGTLNVLNGGTGATSPSGARLNLGAAASGSALTSGLTMSTGRIIGRTTAGAGAFEEISIGNGMSLSGGSLFLFGSITSTSLTMNTARILGRTTAGTSFIEEISIGSGLSMTAGVLSATAGGGGTVTSVSVTSGNGFAGTVATATTTPAITLSTTVTGVIKGNGTAISAAVAGTDYVLPGGALGTPSSGTLTNCTFPTLNQNTTGSAATLTTARTLTIGATGKTFNGSANVTWTLGEIGAAASGANTDITALDQDVTVTATGTIAANTIGYRGLPQNAQTSSYTLALSDAGKHISITTGGVVVPANSSVAFPIGSAISVYNNSASSQTISITSDTMYLAGTATTGSRTLAQRGVATILKVAATTWVISGGGLS
jgi:hypothetical protein